MSQSDHLCISYSNRKRADRTKRELRRQNRAIIYLTPPLRNGMMRSQAGVRNDAAPDFAGTYEGI